MGIQPQNSPVFELYKHFFTSFAFLKVYHFLKIQLETIQPRNNSSFQLLLDSRLNNFYFWHYHPELELNYIEGANGKRHIGEHISRFENGSLVFIGSNIPHLNNDHGIKTDYEKIVLHIQPDFLKEALVKTPE